MDVSIALENKGWLVYNQDPYFDEDELKTREIDILAVHEQEVIEVLSETDKPFSIATDLAIECKKSENTDWVFLTRPVAQFQGFVSMVSGFGSGQKTDFLEVLSNGATSFVDDNLEISGTHFEKYRRVSHIGTEIRIKRQDTDIGKDTDKDKGKGKGREEIFEARNQLMKYCMDYIKKDAEDPNESISNKIFSFLFLAIVFEGNLYEAFLEKGKLRLRRSPRILLKSSIHEKPTRRPKDYFIDVVQIAHFPEYLATVNNDIRLIRRLVKSKSEKLLAEANKVIQEVSKYRSSRQLAN
jgi:hypothetical protein